MQLQLNMLDKHLAQSLSSFYVITSNEYLLALETTEKIRKAAHAHGFTERNILVIERNFKWIELNTINQSQSLFSSKKLIELYIPSGKLDKEGSQELQNYISYLNPVNLTIINLPKLDWITQKTPWVYALQAISIYLDIPLIERSQLPIWITNRLAKQKQSVDKKCLEFIIDHVEGNLLAAYQEIQKLAVLYPSGKLSFKNVYDAIVSVARYDIFELNETIFSGNIIRMMRIINGLKNEGKNLSLILWIIVEEIRILLKLKTGIIEGKSFGILLKENRVFIKHERLIKLVINRITLIDLQTALQEAAKIDRIIKGLRIKTFSDDPWDALTQFSLKLAYICK